MCPNATPSSHGVLGLGWDWTEVETGLYDPAPAGRGQGLFHAVRGAGHLGSGYRQFIKL